MSIITLPTSLKVATMSWGQLRNDMEFRSIFGAQAQEVSAPLWKVSIEPPPVRFDEAMVGAWQSVLLKLRGRLNQFELWNVMRPAPLGTMRGTMTLNANATQGSSTLQIVASGENAKTLKQGDLLGIGSTLTQQVVMLVEDATSNGSGVIDVSIEPPLRNSFLATEAVTWDKPKALFRRTSSESGWDYSAIFVSGMGLDLLEDTRP